MILKFFGGPYDGSEWKLPRESQPPAVLVVQVPRSHASESIENPGQTEAYIADGHIEARYELAKTPFDRPARDVLKDLDEEQVYEYRVSAAKKP